MAWDQARMANPKPIFKHFPNRCHGFRSLTRGQIDLLLMIATVRNSHQSGEIDTTPACAAASCQPDIA
jgi:hypothetical protein